ncbi:uncharacterized protein LOC117170246 [Belonocnema kinseyi]|uniref:uncharacterized protein LOC117170246 n=1 Tax=Belonocnema kinseyi TaxID=2817044 RepID=UPI00143D9126|nr:uncharacterized protein LOC117170246 [Belonocnema kinseyi]
MAYRLRFGLLPELLGRVENNMIVPLNPEKYRNTQRSVDPSIYFRPIYTYRRGGSTFIRFDPPPKFHYGDELWRPSFSVDRPYAVLHGTHFYELHAPPDRENEIVEPQENDVVKRNGIPRATFDEQGKWVPLRSNG